MRERESKKKRKSFGELREGERKKDSTVRQRGREGSDAKREEEDEEDEGGEEKERRGGGG